MGCAADKILNCPWGYIMQDRNAVIVRDVQTEYGVEAVPAGALGADLVNIHEYALFCAHAYKVAPGPQDPPPASPVAGWTWMESPEPLPARAGEINLSGLACQVWCKRPADSAAIALIVFRGTDRTQFGDWYANFRWFTRYIPLIRDQYKQTQRLMPEVVKRIRAELGDDAQIVTAGHSLGGGLAQQAAYAADGIALVYAFDPSTVTGYYEVERAARCARCVGMRIYRVYEHGEILEYLRTLMKAVYPVSTKDPKIVEIRYNRLPGEAVSQHNMQSFAEELQGIAGPGG